MTDEPRTSFDTPSGADLAKRMVSEWDELVREEKEERSVRRWSIGIALALHLGLASIFGFFGALPTIGHEVEPERQIFVVQTRPFEPPPPVRREEIPEPRPRRVPIPDPTPNDPEPIVNSEEIDLEIDLSDTDVIFGPPEAPPISPEGPIPVGGEVQAPIKISGPDPVYPEIARRARLEGVVIVQAIVTKQGVVESAKIFKGLPMGLDQAAADAVRKWRFAPATLHGKPVDVYYTLTVNFQLN